MFKEQQIATKFYCNIILKAVVDAAVLNMLFQKEKDVFVDGISLHMTFLNCRVTLKQ